MAYSKALLLAGLTNEASLWLQAGLMAGFVWEGSAADVFMRAHKTIARRQVMRLLRKAAEGDTHARVAVADWSAAAAGATCYLDHALTFD